MTNETTPAAEARRLLEPGLPPLPEKRGHRDVDGDWCDRGHSDEAMRTYALAAIDDHLSKPEALPPTIEDTLKKCERVATESGAWESYRAVGEAFAELRAALNKLAEATQAAAQTKEPKT